MRINVVTTVTARMHFRHELIDHLDLTTVEADGKRFYQTTSGERFPSVTTMLSATVDKSGLNEWRDRVGEEEALHVMRRSGTRGTAMHNMCEKYLLNDPTYNRGVMPSVQVLFNQVRPVLDARVDLVMATEIPMFSRHLRLAGRCDVVGRFDGKRSIIDYKTTNWAKDMDMLESYFIQEACYAIMFEECYGIPITQLVTISAGESEPEAQVIIEHRDNWAPKALELISKFYENNCVL